MQETITATDGVIAVVERAHGFNWVDALIILSIILIAGVIIIRRKHGTKKNGNTGFAGGSRTDGSY